MTDYAYDYDHDGDRLIIRDTPGGSLGVWNTGLGRWQSAGLTAAEIDILVSAGEFRWRLSTLRDHLGLPHCGPFTDDPEHTPPGSSDPVGSTRNDPQNGLVT